MTESKIEKRTIFSKSLNKEMQMTVYLPYSYDSAAGFPVLYFMHGRSGDENIIYSIDIKNVADRLIKAKIIKPLIVVCPNMENSRGLNSSADTGVITNSIKTLKPINIGRYEDYFIKEIIPFIDKEYKTAAIREYRFVGGASAGGYAALNYGLRYQYLFSRIGGHMPALELQLDEEDIPYFPTMEFWADNNPLLIADKVSIIADMHIYLDSGDNDEGEFYKGCRKLYDILCTRGVDVQNYVFSGHHNLEYIKQNFVEYLKFYVGIQL